MEHNTDERRLDDMTIAEAVETRVTSPALPAWVAPRRKPELLGVKDWMVHEYISWFVNRRAFTRQSERPNENGKHYYYRAKDRATDLSIALDEQQMRRHIAGLQTIGLYAISPTTQKCKWIAIDADYADADRDLAKLHLEFTADGVDSAREMSRRGGHIWIFNEEPLPADKCRIYVYNVATALGIPIKGTLGQNDGLEIFPRQDSIGKDEYGNGLRGPFGIHRKSMERYWFQDAAPTLDAQFAYLRGLKRLTAAELDCLTVGLSIPESFLPPPPTINTFSPNRTFSPNAKAFCILDYVHPRRKDRRNYWAQCPSCAQQGHDRSRDNLAISVAEPTKYKCWANCTKEMIREALGQPVPASRRT
jgi:hypothetical protein